MLLSYLFENLFIPSINSYFVTDLITPNASGECSYTKNLITAVLELYKPDYHLTQVQFINPLNILL